MGRNPNIAGQTIDDVDYIYKKYINLEEKHEALKLENRLLRQKVELLARMAIDE